MPLPTVFLSLSGKDEAFVRKVYKLLPDGLAYFYPESFENGENLISAMERRAAEATMFVLFASEESLKSFWVNFEIDRARLAKIKNPQMKILVFPVGDGVSYSALPEWMREFWIGTAGYTHHDVARYIRKSLTAELLTQVPGHQIFGRGSLMDEAVAALQECVLRTEQTPNVIILSGNIGIGRRTFASRFLAEAFPASPELNYGPTFLLPQFADLTDFYRALRQEIEVNFTMSGFAKDLKAFEDADVDVRVEEVLQNMKHFADIGQAVVMVSGNAIFEDRGFLKAWVSPLFKRLANARSITLVIVSNRLIHENELNEHENVLQLHVPPIQESDIRSLMIAVSGALGGKPGLPSADVIRSIGGHPGVAKAVVAMVGRKGTAIVDNDQSALFKLQEDFLGETLNFDRLTEAEKDVLSVLSWVPQIGGDILKDVISENDKMSGEEFAGCLYNLILACLVQVVGSNYSIASPVRFLFRRLHGYGSTELRKQFSACLHKAWEKAKTDDEVRAELIDAIIYMTAIEGGSLPDEFKRLLLPSTLQEIVRGTYDLGHEDTEALQRVVRWGLPAKEIKMDETTREEILSFVVRAQTRLRDTAGAEDTLQFMDQRAYRSRFYLRSFYARRHLDDPELAISLLKKAMKERKYMGQVVADLAICYQREGRWGELRQLILDEGERINRNASLLDVRVGMLLADNNFPEAERVIEILRGHPRRGNRAEMRTAMLVMKRDHDFATAQRAFTTILDEGGAGMERVRCLRAYAAVEAGDIETAKSDAAYFEARKRDDLSHDVLARVNLAAGDYEAAEAELNKKKRRNVPDELFRARIYERKASDIQTPLSQRDNLSQIAAEIRAKNRDSDEYEINF